MAKNSTISKKSTVNNITTYCLGVAQGGVHPRVLPSVVHLPEVWKALMTGSLQAEVSHDSTHLESEAADGYVVPPVAAPEMYMIS